ncbi:MAG: class I SAM-dependent rRNA methyltransferase [Desulfobulbaceae bacterium]|nr:class I SAM-dependent rRNA methyltransferase [Desulfobulbaceae bacterium]
MELKNLRLKRHEEKRLQGGHLWIYSNEVNNQLTPLKQFQPGEQVRIETHSGKFLGTAYVNPHSLICARMFSHEPRVLDHTLLMHRLKSALSLRTRLFDEPFYRLVYGESDLLPGLVVDRFGAHLSVQLNSAGMEVLKSEIIDALNELLNPESILLRNDSSMRHLEGLTREVETAYGKSPKEVVLLENGVKMLAPLHDGQKTGWFYDQRPNRAMLKPYVQGKRVLDVFSYVGSFAIQAAVFGAKEVMAVDSSRFALEMAEKNAALNGLDKIFNGAEGDAFEVLKALRQEGEQFDVIVVDPPAFIKRKKDHKEGLRAYRRINELAMRLLSDDGLLLSASCSMHLQRDELMDVLRSGGRRLDRHVQVLFEGIQGPDHPVHPAIPETCYLKAFLARISKE